MGRRSWRIELELESGRLDGRVEHVDRVEGKAVLNAETQRRRVRREILGSKG